MGTIAQKLQKLAETKEAIRQAIIGKGQTVANTDPFSSYPTKISAIQTGVDTSDATATAATIRSGYTAYVKGTKITGTMPSQAAQTIIPGTSNKTIASGRYLSGTQTVAGDANLVAGNIKSGVSIFGVSGSYVGTDTSDADATASDILSNKTAYVKGRKITGTIENVYTPTPTITVSDSGKIKAEAVTSTSGYLIPGSRDATKQLTTQAAATITPGTAAKTAVAAGRYTTGAVTVAGDANLVAGNIKRGVSIFGVSGTYSSSGSGGSTGMTDVKITNQLPNTPMAIATVYYCSASGTISTTTVRGGMSGLITVPSGSMILIKLAGTVANAAVQELGTVTITANQIWLLPNRSVIMINTTGTSTS